MRPSSPSLEPGVRGESSQIIPPCPSPPLTHQLQGLAGAAAQGSLGDAQEVPEQHQLLRVAQVVGGTLGTRRMLSAGDVTGPDIPLHLSEVCPCLRVLPGPSAPFHPSQSLPALSPRGSLPLVPPQPFRAPLLLTCLLPSPRASPLPHSFLTSSPHCPSPSAFPSGPSFLHPLSSIPVPSLPFCRPLSLTSLSCTTTTSAWTFLTCSKHLSRKLWGRLLAGRRGVASCTAQSALYQSSSCRAGNRRGGSGDMLSTPTWVLFWGPRDPQLLDHSNLPPMRRWAASSWTLGRDTHPSASWGSG